MCSNIDPARARPVAGADTDVEAGTVGARRAAPLNEAQTQ